MGKWTRQPLPASRQVERPAAGKLSVETQHRAYRHDYSGSVEFDGHALGLHSDSWTWKMLEDLAAFHSLEGAAPDARLKQLAAAFKCLALDREAHDLLDLLPAEVSVSGVKTLFRRSDKLVLSGKYPGSGGPRAMGTFRTFVYEHTSSIELAEEIDEQTVRFRTRAKVESDPRALISDLTDFAGEGEDLPIGATSAQSASDLRDAIRAKATADLQRIRTACIREMEIAAAVRSPPPDASTGPEPLPRTAIPRPSRRR
jgi:hypothetical protein